MKHTPRVTYNCGHKRSYSAKRDAYYCETCDVWFEGNCGDPDCDFCRGRPEKPSLEKTCNQGNSK